MSSQKPGWKDIPIGGLILQPGNAQEYETGDWRTQRPIYNREACIDCFICWVYCPDSAIIVEDEEMKGIDYDHCKGCGICAVECPREEALTMVGEEELE